MMTFRFQARPLVNSIPCVLRQNFKLQGRQCNRRLATVSTPLSAETVEIPCRSNGSIKLDIYHPRSGVPFADTVIYLPAGPVLKSHNKFDTGLLSALQSSVTATLVSINYRAGGPNFWYPKPIHDVLTGYDWIRDQIFKAGHSDSGIGVVGQLLGGSLGATLALTESRNQKIRIKAAALNNPIIDWTVPDRVALELAAEEQIQKVLEASGKPKRGRKKKKGGSSSWTAHADSEQLSASTILAARKILFKASDGYFDPFASPIHFLRTPACTSPADSSLGATQELLRKSPRSFPPADSNILLPKFRISVGKKSILRSQVEEFVERLGKCMDKYQIQDMTSGGSDPTVGGFDISFLKESGLWIPGSKDSHTDVEDTVQWLQSAIAEK